MIDLSFCWIFKETEPETGLARLKECGFEGVEFWPRSFEAFPVDRWAAALRDSGMKCFQLCPYFDFVSGEEKIQESRRLLEEYLGYASLLGCTRIRVFTGPVKGKERVGPREATERQWNDAIHSLQEFSTIAAKQGVELCLECHGGSLMEDSPSALRLIREVDRPNLVVNLQLPLHNEDWRVSLDQLGLYTHHIHIHNWTQGIGQGEATFLSEGAFDWRPVIRKITREFGRRLCLSVEHANHGGRHDPWETAAKDGPFLQELRRSL